jgi:hypothetical protein
MTQMRKAIAAAMKQSQNTAASLTTFQVPLSLFSLLLSLYCYVRVDVQ